MSQWLDIDLSDGTRFNLGSEESSLTLVVLSVVSFLSGIILYFLVVSLMWWPFSVVLLSGLSLLGVRNVIKYILPLSIVRLIQKKSRNE